MKAPLIALTGGGPVSVDLGTYPDSMPLVTARLIPIAILLRPRTLTDFVAAMFWVDAMTERGCPPMVLALPFIPGARQDRLNPIGDALFTAKSIAGMINARKFSRVIVLDPHSEVAPALIDRCRVVSAAEMMSIPHGKYAAVISPDAGAEKRAGQVAIKLEVPLIHAWKTRDVRTGTIGGFGFDAARLSNLALEQPYRMLIVDDICDGGGTFIGLANAIAESGYEKTVDLHLYTTHGIYSKGIAELQRYFSHIYCTDSIVDSQPGVITHEVCNRLLSRDYL